ncbi:unnamed protein product [Schistosoma mattheei]|uniref:Uncharacterized protein n=1 Tax=Schistosoma mattheei TaxID=31246 RepID=A0A183P309_9TREM|nr:unnamed protein product [Schistosoma mattheei]
MLNIDRRLLITRILNDSLSFQDYSSGLLTKTLALDMLTALCLIEGGHVKVLQSFDRLRVVMGEGLRFELLLAAFRYHESLDEESYNLDFAVTCVQFLNIIVHSPENINLRVYLQYELHLLGFDDLLKQIRDRSGSRLKVQIEAYLDNRVDCSLLLEDAEAKEAAVLEQERLEKQLESEMAIARKSEENFKVLGNDGKSVDEVVNLYRLRWLGHVLRMLEHRLPRRAMLTGVRDELNPLPKQTIFIPSLTTDIKMNS